MALLGRDEIKAADDRRYEDIDVPEWGGQVRIMGLTGEQRSAYRQSLVVVGSQGNVQRMNLKNQEAKLLVRAIVDKDLERVYSDEDVAELGRKSGAVLERLQKVALRLSGMRKEDLDDAEGKSATTTSGGSTTD